MSQPSVVAVYGLRPGGNQPHRLGTGSLEHDRVVVLGPHVNELLNSDDPPELLRVGIACVVQQEQQVEVIEIRQVVPSSDRDPGKWAAELRWSADSPVVSQTMTSDDDIKNGICYLFPSLSLCN